VALELGPVEDDHRSRFQPDRAAGLELPERPGGDLSHGADHRPELVPGREADASVRSRTVSTIGADARALLDAELEAATALEGLSGVATAPEARTCLDELHYTMTWFCSGLEKHASRPTRRSRPAVGVNALTADRLVAAPTGADRIRLLTQRQRSVLAGVDGLLGVSLPPEMRAFLEQAHAVLARSIRCCEEAVALLDRKRELRADPAP
jgi:hypothetical protein